MPSTEARIIDGGNGTVDKTSELQALCDTGARAVMVIGDLLVSDTIELAQSQILQGAPRGLNVHPGTPGSRIKFRPSGSAQPAIVNKPGTNDNGVRGIGLDLSTSRLDYGIQYATSYGNVVEDVQFIGRCDVGILLHNTYTCQVRRVAMNGCPIKRAGLFISEQSNVVLVEHFHTSSFPIDAAVNSVGIAIEGGNAHTLILPVLQGHTCAISCAIPHALSILNPYFENVIQCLRTGDPTRFAESVGITAIGGRWAGADPGHSQYASRGPIVHHCRANSLYMMAPEFAFTGNAASSTGPWPILCDITAGRLTLTAPYHYPGSIGSERNLVVLVPGASPFISIYGATYGDFAATELILKKDGAFGGTSYGIRVDNSGNVVTNAYTPASAGGSVSSLLSQALPTGASLVL